MYTNIGKIYELSKRKHQKKPTYLKKNQRKLSNFCLIKINTTRKSKGLPIPDKPQNTNKYNIHLLI